jgi:mannose-6-phosphate isomerase-like protein (cupin superfamily)
MKHSKFEDVKTVSKPWGQEKWIQEGNILGNHNYVLKEIILKKGSKTSLQVHQFKSETNYILEGEGVIVYSDKFFDCEKYLAEKYTTLEIDNFIIDLKFQSYGPGSVMTIEPGTIHRMIADTDLRFVEASTCHLDDVIRLQDDANRSHGKIEAEHT